MPTNITSFVDLYKYIDEVIGVTGAIGSIISFTILIILFLSLYGKYDAIRSFTASSFIALISNVLFTVLGLSTTTVTIILLVIFLVSSAYLYASQTS